MHSLKYIEVIHWEDLNMGYIPRDTMILAEENMILTEGFSPSVNIIFSKANIIVSEE